MCARVATTKRELETADRFTQRYKERCCDAASAVQTDVFGSDFEVNGYTTVEQADVLATELQLGPGQRALDLGAGNGWPGVYLASKTGCNIALADLPRPALERAVARSAQQDVAPHCNAVQATAVALPFRPGSFDAIVHTDVMCCLGAKRAVIRACRRLLKPGGRLAFITIHTPADLDATGRRLAHHYGPRMVNSRRDYGSMLTAAGFGVVKVTDLTQDYLRTSEEWVGARQRHASALSAALGAGRVHELLTDGLLNVAGIRRGVLRRSLFVATK